MPLKNYDTTDSHKKSITSPAIESARAQHDKEETGRQERSRRLEDRLWPELKYGGGHPLERLPNTEYFKSIELMPDNHPSQEAIRQVIEILQKQVGSTGSGPEIKTQDVVEQFLASKKGKVGSPETIISYRHTLSPFAKRCPVLPTTPEPLDAYFARFPERKSAASAYSPIKQLYDFASERHGVKNVMKTVQRPRYKEKEPHSLTLAEGAAALNCCQSDQELGLFHLWYGHGWRPDEPLRLDEGHTGDGTILVKGKTRTEYTPLLPETREILLRLGAGRKPGEPLFVSRLGRRLSDRQAYNIAKGVLGRAGVLDGKAPDLRISTRTLRKTFATLAVEAGGDSRIVDRLLRHRKRDIGDRYIGITMDMLRQTLERYSPLRLANRQPKGELPTIFSCST